MRLSLHLYSSVPDTKHPGRNILVCVLCSVFIDVTAHKERATEMSNRQHSTLSKAACCTVLRRLGTNLLLRSVWMFSDPFGFMLTTQQKNRYSLIILS